MSTLKDTDSDRNPPAFVASIPGALIGQSANHLVNQISGQTADESKSQVKAPNPYTVILLNDDFTPMEFVILILKRFFQKGEEEANRLMMQVHHQGSAVCGVFPFDIAETKVYQVSQYARAHRHPLKCVMEKT